MKRTQEPGSSNCGNEKTKRRRRSKTNRNIASCLARREVTPARVQLPSKFRICAHYLNQAQLRGEADTHKAGTSVELDFLRAKRSKIIEITSFSDVIFALTQSGVCSAFDRDSCRPLCCLNMKNIKGGYDEIIRLVAYTRIYHHIAHSNSALIIMVHAGASSSTKQTRH